MFTASFLVNMRRRALRRGVLYRVLDSVDRAILRLVPMIVRRVRSPHLGVILVDILRRLRDAMDGRFKRSLAQGISKARKIANLAVGWGYLEARLWASDEGFIRYLTVLDLNTPSGWGF